jgi:hypothetical protein
VESSKCVCMCEAGLVEIAQPAGARQKIESVQRSKVAYSKFITPNDTGDTGGHQPALILTNVLGKYSLTKQARRAKTKTNSLL